MSKPSIPKAPDDPVRSRFDKSVKECLETLMGRRSGRIEKLPANATLDDVIAKVNEVIDRLQ